MSFKSLQAVIHANNELDTRQKSGQEVTLSPLDKLIAAMIGNAEMHLHGANPRTVFATWECAKDVEAAYIKPNLGEVDNDGVKIRRLTKPELKELDAYITEARVLFPVIPND